MCIRAVTFVLAVIVLHICKTNALKCRTDDGPSDEDMKRIARSCMRKVSENEGYGNGYSGRGTYSYNNSNNNYSQHNWDDDNFDGYKDKNYNRGGQGNDYDYYGDEFDNGYNYNHNDQDRLLQRNRGRMNTQQGGQIDRTSQADRKRAEQNERRYGSNNNGNNRNLHQNIRNGNQNKNNSSGNNNDGNRHIQKQETNSCVIHCFFQELNVLNSNDFPDKHKLLHVLTKDIRDRELREFYSDTIQECFHLLETERRRDKCQFSKSLIKCMGEYAKANCEDWQNHTLVFN